MRLLSAGRLTSENSSKTPWITPPVRMGTAQAPCSPRREAVGLRVKRESVMASGIQRGSLVLQATPGKSMPGGNSLLRQRVTKSSQRQDGRTQAPRQAMASPFGEIGRAHV